MGILALVVGFVVAAGVVVALGRRWLEGKPAEGRPPESSLIRSWLAISLVGGLLIFVALSFFLDDPTLRSTLIGGLVANAGAAVAFYFASKQADQARRDILNAALGTVPVPDLIGKTLDEATSTIAGTSLRLKLEPATPAQGAKVNEQSPEANEPATPGAAVTAKLS